MSAAEIAQAAYAMALLQARDDDVDPYEMVALLALESLALLNGRDPAAFNTLLSGLGIYADLRRVECWRSAATGQPPPPLGWPFAQGVSVH
jgi:hypothetical protein